MSEFSEIIDYARRQSDDPRVQVGAVVVRDRQILGVGTNRLPFGEARDYHMTLDNKHFFLIHAEQDAILEALKLGDVEGATLYVNAHPCADCAKVIIKTGIQKVSILEPVPVKEAWKPSQYAGKTMLLLADIEIEE